MAEPPALAAAAQAFLDQGDDALLVTDAGAVIEGGKRSRVLVAAADRGALRALDRTGAVPREVRAAVVGVWLDDARAALTFSARPTPQGPSLTAIRSRAEEGGWLCVLRFDRPVAVALVLAEVARQSVARSPVVLPEAAVDVRVVNPIGFDADAAEPVVAASALDLSRGVTEALVRELRPALGVRVDTPLRPADRVALAASGVPLVEDDAAETALADRGVREAHSIRQRRRALDELVPPPSWPSVSVVMATRRPEMLRHALAQVAAQRGDVELVLAPHGFEPEVPAGLPMPVTVVSQPADAIFGDVLNAAVEAASGDLVLKMDDDDWYEPELVADLLRARAYSGADLLGCPDELYHLVDRDLTLHRRHPGERYAPWVAGGTLFCSRALVREVGGFASVPRSVDRHLLGSLEAAGATVYRIHGVGYVLRRSSSGHTWDADVDSLLDPDRLLAQHPGLHLGPLADPARTDTWRRRPVAE